MKVEMHQNKNSGLRIQEAIGRKPKRN